MQLLDCGCGPGTITVGLANAVAPALAVGIDLSGASFYRGDALANRLGICNITFAVADVYELPFCTSRFDVVFARNVFQHLTQPLRAANELRRVLKPNGILALSDDDWDSLVFTPSSPILRQSIVLFRKLWRHRFGKPTFARHHRRLLRDCGFQRVEATASVEFYGTRLRTEQWGRRMAKLLLDGSFRDAVLKQRWIDGACLTHMADEWSAWGERPDAFWSMTACEAVGWNDD
jgi:SAM-dependent methyltransferase